MMPLNNQKSLILIVKAKRGSMWWRWFLSIGNMKCPKNMGVKRRESEKKSSIDGAPTFFILIMSRAPHMRVLIQKQKDMLSASLTLVLSLGHFLCSTPEKEYFFNRTSAVLRYSSHFTSTSYQTNCDIEISRSK